jgi:hypothetical protein
MNRLKYSRVYMSGAMDRVADGGVVWRQELRNWLKNRGIIVFDPTSKPKCVLGDCPDESPENRAKAQALKESGSFEEFRKYMKPIRNVDLRFCDITDFMILNLDLDTHPCGTYNEVFLDVAQKKPILVHCEQGVKNIPNWLFACIPHQLFFETWDDMKEYLRHVDEDQVVDHLNRWYLFDLNELVK